MAGVPFIFGNATTSIPLSNLDADFNTGLTIGNTTVGLGNTVTTLGNVTLTNVNIVSGTVPAATSIVNGSSNVSISSSGGNVNIVTAGTISTFPQANGTVMVSGNMPAFSAYSASTQTVSGSTWTKVILGSEEFDTNNNFASSTFTPTVAGYYQVSGCIQWNATVSISRGFVAIYKNGSAFKYLSDINASVSRTGGSTLIYMNGTTDYLELYGYMTGAGTLYFDTSQLGTYFQAALVRSA